MKKKLFKFLKFSFCFCFILFLFVLFIGVGIVTKYKSEVSFDKEKLTSCTTKLNIYDSENNLLNYASINGNKIISINDLPSYVPNSFISIEDKSFYKHDGLNYKRIVKALITNLTSKSIKQGASTISQQLIKNTHLSNEKTIERKIKEIILTKELEEEYSKEKILETYLNIIYFGNSAYGIEDASLAYFNKSAKELTIAESAGLAGIIKSPKYYSPIYNYDNFNNRKKLVLKNMYNDGYINEKEYNDALEQKIVVNSDNISKQRLVFENAVIDEACKILNCSEKELATMGLQIHTTLKPNVQKSIIDSISNKSYYMANRNDILPDSCIVCLNSKNGAIEGFYGNGSFNFNTFQRQPGSAIKPILVYAPALESNIITPITKINNESFNINGYSPQNVTNTNKEYVSINESIGKSLNIPAVKVLDYVGVEKAMNFAQKNGIKFNKNDKNLNIALGGLTDGVNIIDLAGSYTALSNNGYYSKPYFINKITTNYGREIYSYKNTPIRTMRDDTAYLLTNMLKDATKNGTSKRLKDLNCEIAGKTGTVGVTGTNYNTDAWSVAYTTENIVCSWLGNGDGKSESTLEGFNNGGTFATSMIKQVFQDLIRFKYPENFKKPESVVELDIDLIQYEKNNSIVLADNNLNDCYKMKSLFSVYNLPQKSQNIFQTDLNANIEENKITISFNSYPTISYKLFKISNGKKVLLAEYDKQYRLISYTDNNLTYDCDFYYELEYKINNKNYIESTDNFYIKNEKRWFF